MDMSRKDRGMNGLGDGAGKAHNRVKREPPTDPYVGEVLRLVGGDGSPYSNKMKSLMTYRRLPYRWVSGGGPEANGTPQAPGPVLAPQLLFPDDRVMNDSTKLIQELENLYPAARSVIPNTGGMKFISALLEDFCDEWVTKAMFHYRFGTRMHALLFCVFISPGPGGHTTSRPPASASARARAGSRAST